MSRTKNLVVTGMLGVIVGLVPLSSASAEGLAPSGPDVITADLHQVTHWGTASGIDAYSVGTVSCNIGSEPLDWYGGTVNHPVIGQNMFRLKDGRFEHVGQSWLKWAFASLNQDFCGDCMYPGSGSLLGVNCSDPYSAWLNGSQSGLGPKSVVNPFTGSFPASHSTPGSGTIAGRVQVQTADVDPAQNPGALYFVEGQYVAPDDAAAGNLHNNASWRQVWVESDRDLTFSAPGGGMSATMQTEPAIMAWQEFDPSVEVVTIDVPDDGRLLLAWKVSDLGGDTWNYEFALQNLDSDRGVGGFAVALPAGSDATNLGFHDVDYHSGEPYDDADWAPSTAAVAVHWDTQQFIGDSDANALRWGTLYNFRFDATAPPTSLSTVELTMFKPGTPESLVVVINEPSFPIGDVDCSGAVNSFDIDPFVLALTDPAGYDSAYPDCDINLADINGDGDVNSFDIDPFVLLLTGG